ncbi:MAG: ABC transporter ATP-binding protein [Alphaproteobacteria bacterium]|nr:ABC transporter ATP-binding protein [Alphaproteobacteria bacterium]
MTMAAAPDLLVARNVCKTFFEPTRGEDVEALRDVTVAVRPHEFVSVIGPSGCGKSTFLRIVAGLDRPTAGEILVEGRPVVGPGADRGMVFQEYALLPWKTTRANVEFGLRLKGVPRGERARIAGRFIDLVGLTGFENRYPHHLSGGMRQRAAVARVLAVNPTVLLMDEPFAAVDAMTRQRLQEELAAIAAAERTTVLFVTHAIEEAVFLSDRVVVLSGRPGRIIADMTIALPRPRVWAALAQDAAFVDFRERLTRLIHTGGAPVGGHA